MDPVAAAFIYGLAMATAAYTAPYAPVPPPYGYGPQAYCAPPPGFYGPPPVPLAPAPLPPHPAPYYHPGGVYGGSHPSHGYAVADDSGWIERR